MEEKELDEQIIKAKAVLMNSLEAVEQAREIWMQMKSMKAALYLATGQGSPR